MTTLDFTTGQVPDHTHSAFERGAPGIAARATGLSKTYGDGAAKVTALDDVTVEFASGQLTFGAVLGTLLGLGLGIALQQGLESQGLRTLGIPWGLIVLMLVASVLVGILAAVAPSIRATRLSILGAINRV